MGGSPSVGALASIWYADGQDGAIAGELHSGDSLLEVAVFVTVRFTPPVDFVFEKQMHMMLRKIIAAMAASVPINGHFIFSRSGVFCEL